MLTKKISIANNIRFESEYLTLHYVIDHLKSIEDIIGLSASIGASPMEEYILNNFLEGVAYNR